MLIIIHDEAKPSTPDDYDSLVHDEIQDLRQEPSICVTVLKHMIHDNPCDQQRTTPCQKMENARKDFPNHFCSSQGNK